MNTPEQAIRSATGPVFIKSFRFVSSPAENIRSTTPISAMRVRKSDCCTSPSRLGPIRSPAMISPTTWGALHFLASMPKSFAKMMMIARSLKILYVSIVFSLFPFGLWEELPLAPPQKIIAQILGQ